MGAVGKMQGQRGKREMGMASGLPNKKVVSLRLLGREYSHQVGVLLALNRCI